MKFGAEYYILQNLKPVKVDFSEFHDWKSKNNIVLEKTHVNGWWIVTRFLGRPKRGEYLYESFLTDGEIEKVKYSRTLGEAKNLHYKTVSSLRKMPLGEFE